MKYLGFIIGTNGIWMDGEKISCILDWQTPKNITDVQYFLGFANFYRKDYSKVVTLLTSLTKKEGGKYIPFIWSSEQQAVFDQLNNTITMAPILQQLDYEREIIVDNDASNYVSAGILSQPNNDSILHPVAF